MNFATEQSIAFAVHAHISGLSFEAGQRWAKEIAEIVEQAALDRRYIPGIEFDTEE